MNALLLSNLFPSTDEPARGLFNLRGFGALADLCDVRVVVPVAGWQNLTSPRRWYGVRTERHNNLDAHYIPYWNLPRVGASQHARTMRFFVEPHVRRMHADRPFDVILGAFAYPDLVVAAAIANRLHLPLVGFVPGSDINELARWPALRPQIVAGLMRSHQIIAVSHGLKARVVELGVPAERVIVQHNGVEGDVFTPRARAGVRAGLSVPLDRRLVCFVGNLRVEKGPDVLIDALKRLPEVHAVLIGDGPMRKELEAAGDNRVRFLGRRPAAEVALWLSASDALCLPSRREGCPNVVLEALASGRPVVASDVGGVPELLSSHTGRMVPPDDPVALAKAIQEVIALNWDERELRASVPSLSWADLGQTLHRALGDAVASRGGPELS